MYGKERSYKWRKYQLTQNLEDFPDLIRGAIKVGNTVYLSGVTATDLEGNLVGGGLYPDPEVQATQVFENIKALLEAAGASLDDVVMQRNFLTNREHASIFHKVRDQYYKRVPCSTTVIAGLLRPGALMEIEVTAVI